MFTTQHCDEKHTFRHIIYFLMMSQGVGRGGGGGGSICALLSTSCFVNSTYRWIFIRGIICLPGKEARRRREGRCGGALVCHQCHAICMRKHDSCCQLRLVTLNVQTDCVFSSIEWCWLCAAGCVKCAKYIGCRSVGLPVQTLDPKKSVLMLKSAPNLKCVFNSHQHFSSFCFKMWRSLILCLYFGDALW